MCCGIIFSSQDMETSSIPISGGMDEEDTHTHTHKGLPLSHKEEWNPAICKTWMGTEDLCKVK